MQQFEQTNFEVRDFGLAAYLRARGYVLVHVQRVGSRCLFRFQDRPERLAEQEAYFRGEGSIAPPGPHPGQQGCQELDPQHVAGTAYTCNRRRRCNDPSSKMAPSSLTSGDPTGPNKG
jgi:hypothetical protein